MLNCILGVIAKIAMVLATVSAGSVSIINHYQPQLPNELMKD